MSSIAEAEGNVEASAGASDLKRDSRKFCSRVT